MNRYFVWNADARKPLGPFAPDLLEHMAREGAIHDRTLLARDDRQEWTPACEVPELAARIPRSVRLPTASSIEPSDSWSTDIPAPAAVKDAIPAACPGRGTASPRPKSVVDDAFFDLEIMDLNPGNRRYRVDFGILSLGLNSLVIVGAFTLAMNPLTATILLTLFVAGNLSLGWIFGAVLR